MRDRWKLQDCNSRWSQLSLPLRCSQTYILLCLTYRLVVKCFQSSLGTPRWGAWAQVNGGCPQTQSVCSLTVSLQVLCPGSSCLWVLGKASWGRACIRSSPLGKGRMYVSGREVKQRSGDQIGNWSVRGHGARAYWASGVFDVTVPGANKGLIAGHLFLSAFRIALCGFCTHKLFALLALKEYCSSKF